MNPGERLRGRHDGEREESPDQREGERDRQEPEDAEHQPGRDPEDGLARADQRQPEPVDRGGAVDRLRLEVRDRREQVAHGG